MAHTRRSNGGAAGSRNNLLRQLAVQVQSRLEMTSRASFALRPSGYLLYEPNSLGSVVER
jgi:hypothetical protein